MLIDQYKIEEHNQTLAKEHTRSLEFITGQIPKAAAVIKKLRAFNVAIPS